MSYVWLVVAVDWEEFYVRAVLSTEEAAIARARVEAEREARAQTAVGLQVIIERHRLDPAIDERPVSEYVEFLEPQA